MAAHLADTERPTQKRLRAVSLWGRMCWCLRGGKAAPGHAPGGALPQVPCPLSAVVPIASGKARRLKPGLRPWSPSEPRGSSSSCCSQEGNAAHLLAPSLSCSISLAPSSSLNALPPFRPEPASEPHLGGKGGKHQLSSFLSCEGPDSTPTLSVGAAGGQTAAPLQDSLLQEATLSVSHPPLLPKKRLC